MLTCSEVQELVPEYVAGQLALAELDAMQLHLQKCQSCTTDVAEVSQVWDLLGHWPEEAPSEHTITAIRQAVLRWSKSARRSRKL